MSKNTDSAKKDLAAKASTVVKSLTKPLSAAKTAAHSANTESKMLAIILVRGRERGTQTPIQVTLDLLKLTKKNHCVLFTANPALQGMLQKVKDYVTWGEISDNTYKLLLEKRGKLFEGPLTDRQNKYSYNYSEINGQKYKSYFTLNPPRKGFGRKGIKVAFQAGGALGYRGEKINDLLERMI